MLQVIEKQGIIKNFIPENTEDVLKILTENKKIE